MKGWKRLVQRYEEIGTRTHKINVGEMQQMQRVYISARGAVGATRLRAENEDGTDNAPSILRKADRVELKSERDPD